MSSSSSNKLHARLDALTRAQHVPKPMLDLLALLVANATDTDAFKQSTTARLAIVEGIARQPTEEIAVTRTQTIEVLNKVQQDTRSMEISMLQSFDDMKAEGELRLAQLAEAAQIAALEAERARADARETFSQQVAHFRREVHDMVDVEVAKAKAAISDARDATVSDAQRRLSAAHVDTLEDTGAALGDLVTDARSACDAALGQSTSTIASACREAVHTLQTAAAKSHELVTSAMDTLNALPLLECHRLQSAVALVEARVDVADTLSARRAVDDVIDELGQLRRRVEAAELGLSQVRASESLFLATGVSRRESAAASPTGSPSRRQPSSSSLPATPRARTALLLADEHHGSSNTRRPSPSSLRDHFESSSPSRGGQQPTTTTTTRAVATADMSQVVRLTRRCDVLERSQMDQRHELERAFDAMKRLSRLIDQRVVDRLDLVDDGVTALLTALGTTSGELTRAVQSAEAAGTAAMERFHSVSVDASGLLTPRGDVVDADEVELRAARASLVTRKATARWLHSLPAFRLFAPMPNLGLELRNGEPPVGGVLVVAVAPGGAAAAAGLDADDAILRIDGAVVATRDDAWFALAMAPSRPPAIDELRLARSTLSSGAASTTTPGRPHRGGASLSGTIPFLVFRPSAATVFNVDMGYDVGST